MRLISATSNQSLELFADGGVARAYGMTRLAVLLCKASKLIASHLSPMPAPCACRGIVGRLNDNLIMRNV